MFQFTLLTEDDTNFLEKSKSGLHGINTDQK